MSTRVLRAAGAATAAAVCLAFAAFGAESPPDPHALVDASIAAMQGTASVGSARAEGIQHEFMLGNAERAEGPWRTFYTHFAELRDGQGRYRRTDRSIGSTFGPERVFVASDGVLALRAA
ncbi:MAG TPA: hypothetical protein VF035_10230, partial [Longimicrobiales bacterium]